MTKSFTIMQEINLMLHFIGDTEIEDEGCNLLIKNFNCCVFNASGHDIKKYDHGEVVLSGF